MVPQLDAWFETTTLTASYDRARECVAQLLSEQPFDDLKTAIWFGHNCPHVKVAFVIYLPGFTIANSNDYIMPEVSQHQQTCTWYSSGLLCSTIVYASDESAFSIMIDETYDTNTIHWVWTYQVTEIETGSRLLNGQFKEPNQFVLQSLSPIPQLSDSQATFDEFNAVQPAFPAYD